MSNFRLTPISNLAVLAGSAPGTDIASAVMITERTGMSICSVLSRNGAEGQLAEQVQAMFAVELPRQPRYARAGATAFVWAGPSQWLALQDADAGRPFERYLQSSLQNVASVMDQSDGRTIVRIRGACARDALAKGLLIDLHPRAFKPGDTAVTAIAHIGVHFWQLDDAPTYEFAMFRSFAVAFWEWITDAAAEFDMFVK